MQESLPSHKFDNVSVIQLDITDSSSLSSAVTSIKEKYGKLTDLLHNTGIAAVDGDNMSPDILDVNVRCAKETIEAFLPIMPESGKIALVSSEVGAWYAAGADQSLRQKLEDVPSNDWETINKYIKDWVAFSKNESSSIKWSPTSSMLDQAYGVSKALVTAWARNFASTSKIPIAIVCPGYCATELNGWSGPRSAEVGGISVAWPLLNEFESGHFYQDGKDLPIVFPMPKEFFQKKE